MPSGSEAMLARIRASARAESAASAVSTVSSPYSSSSAWTRRSPRPERIELAVEIAPIRLRHARIGGEDVDDVLLQDAVAHKLHRRNSKSFLKALGCLGVEIAWHIAADIEPMSDRGEPGEHLAAAHDRAHQADIVEMRAAVIGIVEEIGVALLADRRRCSPCRSRP